MAVKMAVPKTAAEMQELMDDQQKLGRWLQDGGVMSELVSSYAKATDERGEMTEMIVEAVKSTMVGKNEITDIVNTQAGEIVSKLLKEHGVNRPMLGGATEGGKQNSAYNKLAPGAALDGAGFVSLGDYARTVFNKGRTQDPRRDKVIEVMNAYSSSDPAAAGFLIPEQFASEVRELSLEQSVVRPRASIMTMSALKQVVPYVDETTHVGSVFGGMSFAWTPESGTISASEATFGRVMLEAHKLTGLARVPNELWADAPALSSFLMRSIPRGIAFTEDVAFLTGSGSGQPLGVQNTANTALVTITKETNQVAATILVENVLKMYARMLPQSLGSSVWLASPSTFPQLMALSISVGTGGAPVALVDIHASPTMTLLGRPLILTEKVPALGSAGDIGLYDFGFYMVGDRQAVSLESSEHSRFANDETELRAILRVDGRPWIQSPLTPANGGDTLSPFVILGARA